MVTRRTRSGRFADLDAEKLRGGYSTSDAVDGWLCASTIRTRDGRALEPSCGDGALDNLLESRLCQATVIMESLGLSPSLLTTLWGPFVAACAAALLRGVQTKMRDRRTARPRAHPGRPPR